MLLIHNNNENKCKIQYIDMIYWIHVWIREILVLLHKFALDNVIRLVLIKYKMNKKIISEINLYSLSFGY